MSPSRVRLYWAAGGEILTRGGPLRLTAAGDTPEVGCRPITVQRAAELWAFYSLKAAAASDAAVRRHCDGCAGELQQAMAQVAAWRRAA